MKGEGVSVTSKTVEKKIIDYEEEAKRRWNKEADEYNQWSELGQDEKDELIERLKEEEG